jgi:hypothetical protein
VRDRRDLAIVAALLAAAAAMRAAPLGATSLWRDDAWPALVVRADSLHEVLLSGAWAPAFVVLLKGWLAAFGFSELNAQLLPFLLAVATPALLYGVLVRRGLARFPAAAGAFVLLTSSVHIVYAARVKQYTLDALCVVGVLAAAWWLLENVREDRRWRWFAGASLGAIALSSLAAVVVAASVGVALVVRTLADRRGLAGALGSTGVIVLFAAGWWWFLLRPRVTSNLREHFQARFFGVDGGVGEAIADLAEAAVVVVRATVALPGPAEGFVVFAAAAVVLWRRPALGFLLLAPLGVATALAALELAPLGSGRTDIYLFPLLAALVALAVNEAFAFSRRATIVVVVLLGAVGLATYRPADYPEEAVRPLVEELEERAAESDAVLVYRTAWWQFALYTDAPVDLVEDSRSQTGFNVRIGDPDVFVLEGRGVDDVNDRYETLWFLAARETAVNRLQKTERLLRERGYRRMSVRRQPGASLSRWSSLAR